jgi:hypothetical protein
MWFDVLSLKFELDDPILLLPLNSKLFTVPILVSWVRMIVIFGGEIHD